MHTQSDWAPALVYLTHSLAGFFYRRNGKLGAYRVWHDRLDVKLAKLGSAQFVPVK
ncbi:hypothetical protein GY065_01850 [Snodgrassella sp. ESL0323]|uniref:hypothetical protein n=1 Tax=Snodgrassella sp. ESL0323 TaxID=2705034 RepID=UPI001581A79D|nr:hypothetical protein [Snodgrassella sp. ESL0323]NUF77683.1 hypothetical protein [Snodgrassella sp. ESL0323]